MPFPFPLFDTLFQIPIAGEGFLCFFCFSFGSEFRKKRRKKQLTKSAACAIIHPLFIKGEWCNGNTWVSKTFVEGSNPSSPAEQRSLENFDFQGFSCVFLFLMCRIDVMIFARYCIVFSNFQQLFSQIILKSPSNISHDAQNKNQLLLALSHQDRFSIRKIFRQFLCFQDLLAEKKAPPCHL